MKAFNMCLRRNRLQWATQNAASNWHYPAARCNGFNSTGRNKLNIENLDLHNKRIFIRADFDVPMKSGKIISSQKVAESLDTIKYLLSKQVRSIVLVSHLGRPKGRRNSQYTMKPIAGELEKMLSKKVIFLPDCIGFDVENTCKDVPKGSIILLENLRFYPEEEGIGISVQGDNIKPNGEKVKQFREQLAKLGDVYINDAFSICHKPYSSMMGEGFKERAAGLLLRKELKYFSKAMHNPPKPFLAIVGGTKLLDKLPLIHTLLDKADDVIFCGDMAFTFLKVLSDMSIGTAEVDKKESDIVFGIIERACDNNVEIYLPIDFICGTKANESAEVCKATVQSGIPQGYLGLDIGPKSQELFANQINKAKFILWNGPPGAFEINKFAQGSKSVVDAVAYATSKGAISIISGRHTSVCCETFKAAKRVSHISMANGAVPELLMGNKLPGIESLSDFLK